MTNRLRRPNPDADTKGFNRAQEAEEEVQVPDPLVAQALSEGQEASPGLDDSAHTVAEGRVSKPEDMAGKAIRKVLHQDEWWFSIIDVVEVLVGGDRPRKYWNDLKTKLASEGYDQLSENIGQLKLLSRDGKAYFTDCANTETLFRIIQSIPSPKVEPLKRWLAKVGKERIEEIENPGLSMERMQEVYEQKGYLLHA